MTLVHSDRMLWLDSIAGHAKSMPDRVAIREVCHTRGAVHNTTYGELESRSDRASELLQDLAPAGSSVLLCLQNGPGFLITLIGAFKAGLPVLPVSTASTVHELQEIARVVQASVFVRSEDAKQRIDDPDVHETDVESLCIGSPDLKDRPPRHPSLMLRTSGTTGMPKVVSRDMNALDQVADNLKNALQLTVSDSVLALVPMCHSYGIEHCVLAPLHAGSEIISVGGIDSAPIHALINDSEATVFPGFPFAYERMLEETTDPIAPSLRLAYSAGSKLPQSVSDRFKHQFGIPLGQLYGSTEVGSVLFNDPHARELGTESVGFALPDVHVRVLDPVHPDLDSPLADETEGQLAVRSSTMLSHYVGQKMDDMLGDFFLTGDIARRSPSGAVTITGRLKHQIDIAGAKVNPLEVEATILQLDGIAECLVVSCVVRGTLKRLRALLVAQPDADPPSVSEIKRHLRSRLSAYKVPRIYEFQTNLPRTPLGKIIRTEKEL